MPRENVAGCRALLSWSRYFVFDGVLQHHGPQVMLVVARMAISK